MPDQLTDRELDAWIAENLFGPMPSRNKPSTNPGYFDQGSPTHWEWAPKLFSTDRNAAALVLEKVGELGLWYDVTNQLFGIVGRVQDHRHLNASQKAFVEGYSWDCLTATPRQLMDAVKIAWESRKAGDAK